MCRREVIISIPHLDDAVVDNVVPHNRSISRDVSKRPNGLKNKTWRAIERTRIMKEQRLVEMQQNNTWES